MIIDKLCNFIVWLLIFIYQLMSWFEAKFMKEINTQINTILIVIIIFFFYKVIKLF